LKERILSHFQKIVSTSLLTKQRPISKQFQKIEISALLLHSSGYLAYYIIYVVLHAKLPQNEPKSIAQ